MRHRGRFAGIFRESRRGLDGAARHGRTEIYFRCDDVDAAAAELRSAGVEIIQEATDQPWGERDVAVIDPDGLPVFLTQQIEP